VQAGQGLEEQISLDLLADLVEVQVISMGIHIQVVQALAGKDIPVGQLLETIILPQIIQLRAAVGQAQLGDPLLQIILQLAAMAELG
jgi:hypothetical protein